MNGELLLILNGLSKEPVLCTLAVESLITFTDYWVFKVYRETLLELSQKGSKGKEVG